jgi:hypothetical protein
MMVVGGHYNWQELDLVELVPLRPLNDTVPTCLRSLTKFPSSLSGHMGGTVNSGKQKKNLN